MLDMVSELFLAVLQHVKSALQGIVEYRKRGADMSWDEFLATANVRWATARWHDACPAPCNLVRAPSAASCRKSTWLPTR